MDSTLVFGAQLDLQRYFRQRLQTPWLEANIQRTLAGASFELGWRLSTRSALFVALGAAVEVAQLSTYSAVPGVQLAAQKLGLAPACARA